MTTTLQTVETNHLDEIKTKPENCVLCIIMYLLNFAYWYTDLIMNCVR